MLSLIRATFWKVIYSCILLSINLFMSPPRGTGLFPNAERLGISQIKMFMKMCPCLLPKDIKYISSNTVQTHCAKVAKRKHTTSYSQVVPETLYEALAAKNNIFSLCCANVAVLRRGRFRSKSVARYERSDNSYTKHYRGGQVLFKLGRGIVH